jgi:hypothetical protein
VDSNRWVPRFISFDLNERTDEVCANIGKRPLVSQIYYREYHRITRSMKPYLIAIVTLGGMAGAYWLGRSGSHAVQNPPADTKMPPAIEITDESIRILPGGVHDSVVQQSDDGQVKVEGQLTIAPAPGVPVPRSGNTSR